MIASQSTYKSIKHQVSVLPHWFIPLLSPLHLVGTSNSDRLWALPRLIRSISKMPFFHLAMLDALALGLLLIMSELLSLVFASMGFTMRIQWYHHIHTLIMGYAFILFIRFVTYEERLMRPPCHCLNRSRLRSRSVPNEVSEATEQAIHLRTMLLILARSVEWGNACHYPLKGRWQGKKMIR